MAAPTLVATPTVTTFATSVTTMAVNYPASVTAGNKLTLKVSVRNSGSWGTPPTGWSQRAQQLGGGSASQLTIFERTATGSEGGTTVTFTASVGTTATWQMSQWSGANTSAIEVTTNSGDAVAVDPPNNTPAGGSNDYTYEAIAGHAAGSTSAYSAGPSGYSGFQNSGGSSGGSAVSLGTAYKATTASTSENPGAFTASNNRFWAGATIAIAPSGGGGGTTGQIKVWNGSSFVAKPVKVYNGSTWVTKPVKSYNGSTWVTTPY